MILVIDYVHFWEPGELLLFLQFLAWCISLMSSVYLIIYITYIIYHKDIQPVYSASHSRANKFENYSKTCLKRPLKNRQNKGLNEKL